MVFSRNEGGKNAVLGGGVGGGGRKWHVSFI